MAHQCTHFKYTVALRSVSVAAAAPPDLPDSPAEKAVTGTAR